MLRSAIPFKIGEQKHILRVSIPIITRHPFLENDLSDMPMQFNLQYEHNFADELAAPKDVVRFNIKVLLPTL
jgi:hypothetical protein